MTTNTYLVRLTKLAQRVWLDARVEIEHDIDGSPMQWARVLRPAPHLDSDVEEISIGPHPRASSMLEAALREAVDPPVFRRGDRVQLEDGRRGSVLWVIPAGTQVAIYLDNEPGAYHIHPSGVRKVETTPPAWVEELAREWDRRSGDEFGIAAKHAVQQRADELRVRAKAECMTDDRRLAEQIEAWHRSDSHEPLHVWLGMTFEEYARWVERHDVTKPTVVAEAKDRSEPLK